MARNLFQKIDCQSSGPALQRFYASQIEASEIGHRRAAQDGLSELIRVRRHHISHSLRDMADTPVYQVNCCFWTCPKLIQFEGYGQKKDVMRGIVCGATSTSVHTGRKTSTLKVFQPVCERGPLLIADGMKPCQRIFHICKSVSHRSSNHPNECIDTLSIDVHQI